MTAGLLTRLCLRVRDVELESGTLVGASDQAEVYMLLFGLVRVMASSSQQRSLQRDNKINITSGGKRYSLPPKTFHRGLAPRPSHVPNNDLSASAPP